MCGPEPAASKPKGWEIQTAKLWAPLSHGHLHHLTGFQRRQEREHFGHERKCVVKLDAGGFQPDDGEGQPAGRLLKNEITVAGEKHVKPIFDGEGQELSVLYATPAHFLGGDGVMAGERAAQPPVETLIN